jgi:hypothetical protein
MSLPTDVLAKATPTRLICRGGRWVLELTRLEAVDRDVFQPRLARLEGADLILALLRRSEEGQHLASGAAQLMRSPRTEEDRAFDASEGDWVPSSEPPPPPRAAAPPSADSDNLASVVAELRAELVVLRASHSRLRDRVMALEAAQSGLPQPNVRPPRGSRARRRSEPPPGLTEGAAPVVPFGENAAFAATQASPGLPGGAAPAAAPPPPAPGPPPAAAGAAMPQSFTELARSIVGEQLPPVLALPLLPALNECLGALMEGAPLLEASQPIDLFELGPLQACKLLDDDGRECGAILLDLRAAVLLGAALLAVPRDEALRQINENDASEDTLLAMSEICNNLTAPVNAVPTNRHVRATTLAGVDVGALPKSRARLDLTVDGGRLVLVMF